MKIKNIRHLLMIISIALLCCGVYSCGGDEDESPIQPPVEQPTSDKQPTGEITFSVEGNGNGEGTTSSPAVVETGDTLNMAINQKSVYTDPNGSVYVCEPKASIKLFADSSTVVYTKNFQTLTDVKEISLKNAEKENGEALQRQTLQTFSIGGKEVTFDLMHEIYRHVNSENTMIEMPYIKVNAAEYGAANTEEGAQTRADSAPASVTNMRIKPHMPVTRGAIVDSTMYDVSVAFNVELQTVHTKEPQSKTLSFEINFTAVVESTTEYPDPTLGFSYSLEILGGTTSTASPFVYSSGETLALKWVENIKYDYFSITNRNMEEISYEATANADLIASKDTVWVEDVDELEKVVTGNTETSVTDVNDTKLHTGKKSFTIGGEQKVDFNWNYQAYQETEIEGVKVAWPYMTLSEPQLVSVQKTEVPNAKIAGKKAKVYELSLRFKQDIGAENTPQPVSESVEYIVKYKAVIGYPEPTLDFTYNLAILGGTNSKASPFVYLYGDTLALKWTEKVNYDYFSLSDRSVKKLSYETDANARLTASVDTLWVDNAEELEKVVAGKAEISEKDNGNMRLYSGKKKFTSGKQTVNINWSYNAFKDVDTESGKVSLPYLTLSEPQLVSVQKTELPFVTIPGKNAKVYEVTMVLKQKVTGVHTPKEVNETVEYIVKYIGAVELKLLEVKYRKAYEWYEPHDNLPIRNQYILYKDSIFSDGTTRTAEAHSQTCTTSSMTAPLVVPLHGETYNDTLYHRYDGNDFFFHKVDNQWNLPYKSPMITATKTGVPDLSKLSVGEPMESNYDGEPCTNLEAYFYGTTNDRFNPENPQNGWYVGKFAFASDIELNYAGIPIRQYALILIWYDRFAYTDGKMFDFLDYKATLEFNFKQENTTMPDGSPAIVFTHEGIIHWCGKDFYSATVDSVYQRK